MDVSLAAPSRKSLTRQIAWFGGDRMLVGGAGLLLSVVGITMFRGFGILYGLSIIIPVVCWFGVIWVARLMFKADPLMLKVIKRQFRYREVYAPKSDLGVAHPQIRDFR